ncbi:unnamed protein product, partial [Ilex paraguariensis]
MDQNRPPSGENTPASSRPIPASSSEAGATSSPRVASSAPPSVVGAPSTPFWEAMFSPDSGVVFSQRGSLISSTPTQPAVRRNPFDGSVYRDAGFVAQSNTSFGVPPAPPPTPVAQQQLAPSTSFVNTTNLVSFTETPSAEADLLDIFGNENFRARSSASTVADDATIYWSATSSIAQSPPRSGDERLSLQDGLPASFNRAPGANRVRPPPGFPPLDPSGHQQPLPAAMAVVGQPSPAALSAPLPVTPAALSAPLPVTPPPAIALPHRGRRMPVLPPLNEGNIKLWLTQVEMMAHDVGLVDDKATFYAVASRLPERAANAAADILQDASRHSWALLRQRLEKDFSKTSHQAMHDFLSNTKREKGERPTAFLRRLRIASENKATDPILLSFVLASLPTSLQQTLQAARVQTPQDAAEAADEALSNELSSTVAAASVSATATSAIDAKLDKLTALMGKFFSSNSVSAVSGQQRQSRQRSRANSEERPSSKREDTPGRPRSRSRSL